MKLSIIILLITLAQLSFGQSYIDTTINLRLPVSKVAVFKRGNVKIGWLATQLINDARFDSNGKLVGYLNVTTQEAASRQLKSTYSLSQNDLSKFSPRYRSIGRQGDDGKADNVSISFPTPPKRGSQEEGFLNNALLDLERIINSKLDRTSATKYYGTEAGKGLYEKVLRRIAFIQYFTSK